MFSLKCFQLLFVLLFALNYLCDSVIIDYNNPIAQTAYGQVRGKQYLYSSNGTGITVRQVVAFIGVPYARPPVGVNRFLVCYDRI